MSIVFHKETRTFHLYNDSISYIFRVMENDQLEHLYYGRKISDEQSYDIYHEETMRALMSVSHMSPMRSWMENLPFFRCLPLIRRAAMKRRRFW